MQDSMNVFNYLQTDKNGRVNSEDAHTMYHANGFEDNYVWEATSGFSIRRNRLLQDLTEAGISSGLTFVCAPYGFGKTQLLLAYAQYVRSMRDRGVVRMVDAGQLTAEELIEQLVSFEADLSSEDRPLVIVDNIKTHQQDILVELATTLRRLRKLGFELVCSVASSHHPLVCMMTDSYKLGASALKLQVKEMSEWMKALAISPQLDLYEMSQGIPALVRSLQGQTEVEDELSAYNRELKSLFIHVLDDAQRYGVQDCLITMLLMEHGTFAACNEFGITFSTEQISLISHDYPLFGIDVSKTKFQCPRLCNKLRQELLLKYVSKKGYLIASSVRILLTDNRVDEAIALMNDFLTRKEMVEIISQYPMTIPLMGHAHFVMDVLSDSTSVSVGLVGLPIGLVLSGWASALMIGDLKSTAAFATELLRRADEIEQGVLCSDWLCAEAFQEIFAHKPAFELPHIGYLEHRKQASHAYVVGENAVAADGVQHLENDEGRNEALLRLHSRAFQAFVEGDCECILRKLEDSNLQLANTIDIPAYLLLLDKYLMQAVSCITFDRAQVSSSCSHMRQALLDANLKELSAVVDAVQQACLMFACGEGDEAHSIDNLQVIAVRRSSVAMQLLCRIGAGWNELILSQASNAHFRAQQTEKVCPENFVLLLRWTYLLEVCALTRMSSRASLQERMKQIDPEAVDIDFFEAWAVAIMLLSLRYDSELSAWYSAHKEVMLNVQYRCIARLALSCTNVPIVTLRRILPTKAFDDLVIRKKFSEQTGDVAEEVIDSASYSIGQLSIKLFGGFSVSKNGHLLTEKSWRRRKAALLCARLALVNGNFVSRRALIEEFWPEKDYQKGRENLYVTLSQMRKSLGQIEDGPQYIVVQGDGIALNKDYVETDIQEFDRLVREILMAGNKADVQHIIDVCFKLESLYAGQLFIPETGEIDFFVRARELYDNKFVDAMLIGSKMARNDDRASIATWFITAALKQQRYREDVVREAMLVMDKQGRRREIVQLYSAHHKYFAEELDMLPEKETQELYDKLLHKYQQRSFL